MTNKVLEFIATETNGKCYQSFRYCADDEIRMPTLDYEDKGSVPVKSRNNRVIKEKTTMAVTILIFRNINF